MCVSMQSRNFVPLKIKQFGEYWDVQGKIRKK